jgi:hypothetical protein
LIFLEIRYSVSRNGKSGSCHSRVHTCERGSSEAVQGRTLTTDSFSLLARSFGGFVSLNVRGC